MQPRNFLRSSKAFTLIELLVVITIIAILSVVVIVTLNPAELLRQSHDSSRVSDMSTLTSALGVYTTDQSSASSFSMGSSNTVYVSIPDPTATSTAGDQCQGLGLPTLPATYSYHCAPSSTFRNTNGTGWIPVKFQSISSGSPIDNLSVDPTNQTSSRFYYTYTTNGLQYETTAAMESQKYGVGGSSDVISSDGGVLTSVYEKGTKLGLEPLDYGDNTLAGYWPLNEGTGTIAYDYSGNGNNGTWTGTQAGTNGYYTTNTKIGSYAGNFNGINDLVTLPVHPANGTSIAGWIYANTTSSMDFWGDEGSCAGMGFQLQWTTSFYTIVDGPCSVNDINTGFYPQSNRWYFVVQTFSPYSTLTYVNGSLVSTIGVTLSQGYQGFWLGKSSGGSYFTAYTNGAISDVRMYNRVLSAAQIGLLYSGGK